MSAAGIVQTMKNRCWRKKVHMIKRSAVIEAQNLTKAYGIKYKVYKCNMCGNYHVGRIKCQRFTSH